MNRICQQEEVYIQNRSPVVRTHVAIKYLWCKHKLTKEEYKLGRDEVVFIEKRFYKIKYAYLESNTSKSSLRTD